MNTVQINKRLVNEKHFLGTFPCGRIPPSNVRPLGVIINTDKANEKGEHWVAVYVNSINIGENFYSFGIPPLQPEIIRYLNSTCYKWVHNPFKLQSDLAATCGNYCLFFVEQRLQGLSFEDIISLLTSEPKINDGIIRNYTERHKYASVLKEAENLKFSR